MKFLADMGISQSTTVFLKEQGFDAVHLRDQNLQRLPDPEIIQKGYAEGRIILTCDLEFGSLMAASGNIQPSVILFRLEDETPGNVNRRLLDVLESSQSALEQGAIIAVEETRHRIRLLPINP